MIDIARHWHFDHDNASLLSKRPRVDYRVSEYVINYIHKAIPQFDKVLVKGGYSISLSFNNLVSTENDIEFYEHWEEGFFERLEGFGYFTDWDYNTEDTYFNIFGKNLHYCK